MSKKKILIEACRFFAKEGYKDTTFSKISKEAGVNLASINYHFCNKALLYREAWKHALSLACEKYPDPSDDLDSDEWLFVFIKSKLQRIFDEGDEGLFPRILDKEMSNPTDALKQIANEEFMPRHKKLSEVISKYLACEKDGLTISLAAMSVLSQIVLYVRNDPLRVQFFKNHEKDIDILTNHIKDFCIAGFKSMKGFK